MFSVPQEVSKQSFPLIASRTNPTTSSAMLRNVC